MTEGTAAWLGSSRFPSNFHIPPAAFSRSCSPSNFLFPATARKRPHFARSLLMVRRCHPVYDGCTFLLVLERELGNVQDFVRSSRTVVHRRHPLYALEYIALQFGIGTSTRCHDLMFMKEGRRTSDST